MQDINFKDEICDHLQKLYKNWENRNKKVTRLIFCLRIGGKEKVQNNKFHGLGLDKQKKLQQKCQMSTTFQRRKRNFHKVILIKYVV